MSSHLPQTPGHDRETRPGNLLLAAVPADEYEEFRELLETYPLRMRETLQEAGDPPDWVYFPTSGVISVLTVLERGNHRRPRLSRDWPLEPGVHLPGARLVTPHEDQRLPRADLPEPRFRGDHQALQR